MKTPKILSEELFKSPKAYLDYCKKIQEIIDVKKLKEGVAT